MTRLRPHFPGLKPGPSDVSSIDHATWSLRLPKVANYRGDFYSCVTSPLAESALRDAPLQKMSFTMIDER